MSSDDTTEKQKAYMYEELLPKEEDKVGMLTVTPLTKGRANVEDSPGMKRASKSNLDHSLSRPKLIIVFNGEIEISPISIPCKCLERY